MKKTFLLLAVMCCMGAIMAQNNEITFKCNAMPSFDAYGIRVNNFGVKLVSSYFKDGIGHLIFDGDVTTIGDSAFYGVSSVYSITLPSTVVSIGNLAFYDCWNLVDITIPNTVTQIAEDAFTNVPNIIYKGSLSGAPWGATHMNYFVEECLLYKDATKKNLTFCSRVKKGKVVIPNTVDTIEEKAFQNANLIDSVIIPNSVRYIEDFAFSSCKKLTYVYLPHSIREIPYYCFHKTALKRTVIPSNITEIGGHAFSYCSNLLIHINAQMPPKCGSYCFGNVPESTPIYVPTTSLTLYQAADTWKDFTNIQTIQQYPIYIYSEPICDGNYWDVLGDDMVSYVNATKTLMLKNANLSYDGEAIAAYEPITIDCMGNDTVECTSADYNALYCEANSLTFSGSGSVRLIAPQEAAINLGGEMIIRGGCTVTVSSGIDVAIAMTGEPLTIDGASLIARGNGMNPTIVGCNNLILKNGATILSNHTYDATSHKFYVKGTTNEAKDDIIIGIDDPTGIEEVTGDRLQVTGVRKVMRDGQLLIIRDGNTYNAQGSRL